MAKFRDVDQTFTLEELDDVFWDKVISVEKCHSSGMGGPGCLWIFTTDKLLYQICLDDRCFPFNEDHLEAFCDFFAVERYDKNKRRDIYRIESEGWCYFWDSEDVWIRQEYTEAFREKLQEEKKGSWYVFKVTVFAEILGIQDGIPRIRERKFAMLLEKNLIG